MPSQTNRTHQAVWYKNRRFWHNGARQKRKKSWRVQVRRKGGAMSATFDTKAEAEAWAIATEAKILAGNGVESIVQEDGTLRQAVP